MTGLFLLAAGMLFGITGALQYIIPGFLKQTLSFEAVRPLHVSSVIFWILFASTGSVLSYLQEYRDGKLFSEKLSTLQFYLFTGTAICILVSYVYGTFGGREYWEFHPAFGIPLATGWLLFIVNVIRSAGSLKDQPVYIWMWLTGALFFLFTFIESYLWLFPYFRADIVNDMTIQWKSYGSMVGSWNMLIYGCSIFLMEKISGEKRYSRSYIAFVLYFTGLFNLMFNWGHHIYTLPTHSFIKHVSYAVSMTELFILGRIILTWRSSLDIAKKYYHNTAYRFLLAADIWVFLTLSLAIAMSIPVINRYTHGTHITVAHTMGATIGINSFLLLAIASDILQRSCIPVSQDKKWFNRGWTLANVSLFIFWSSLIGAGMIKARWQMGPSNVPFSTMMRQSAPFFITFFAAGITLSCGIFILLLNLAKNPLMCYWRKRRTKKIISP